MKIKAMRRSCSEAHASISKASIAAGYPPGLADDIAAAAILLSVHGYSGVAAALRSIRHGVVLPQLPAKDGSELVFEATNAAAVGMAAAEVLCAAHQTAKKRRACFNNIDSPLLLAGLVALAASHYQIGYVLTFYGDDGSDDDICIPTGKQLLPAELAEPLTAEKAQLVVSGSWTANDKPTMPPLNGITVSAGDWQEVEQLAAQTYVVPSDESRAQGAGAGEIDND